MRNFNCLCLVVVLLLLGMAVFGFVLENQVPVSLSFYGWASITLPLALLVLTSMLVGGFLGGALVWLSVLGRKRSVP